MEITLEQQVINALIRRKADYLCAAVDSPEYRKAAGNAKAEAASYAMLARNPEVSEAVDELCEIIDSASDELKREEFATKLAYNTYNNPHETESKAADMLGYSERFEAHLKNSVHQKVSAWKRMMERQYGLVISIVENAMEFGAESALTKEGITDAVRTKFGSAMNYLEFERELQDSIEAFSQLNAELAMNNQVQANQEMAKLYGDRLETYDSMSYLTLIFDKGVGLAKVLCLKAAEIEANEVFLK